MKIPPFWSPIVRYIAAPALAIVYSFSYPAFHLLRNDPFHVMGFGVGHIALIFIFAGFIVPKWFDVFIPPSRRGEGKVEWGANVAADTDAMERNAKMEQAHKLNNGDMNIDESAMRDGNDLSASSSDGDKSNKGDSGGDAPTGHVTQ